MKRLCMIFVVLIIPSLLAVSANGICENSRSMTVQFSNTGRPGSVKLISGRGDVTVTGYDGKDVQIEVKSSDEISIPSEDNEKAKGMKRISGSGFNVDKVKEENAIIISRSMKSETELVIKVPRNTILKIGGSSSGMFDLNSENIYGQAGTGDPNYWTDERKMSYALAMQKIALSYVKNILNFTGGIFQGNITVEHVDGDMEINTMNGNITMRDISGDVTASALEGDVTIVFKSVKSSNPMAFSTMNGDIDVTFPSNIKATINAKNVEGEIYTDFDMEISPGTQVSVNEKQTGIASKSVGLTGSLGALYGNSVTGNINGGGHEIQMTTIEGDIYIRKSKKVIPISSP